MIFLYNHFPRGSDGRASAYNVGDPGSVLGWEDLLEKEMATHSSIPAWKSPWMEKPGGLQVQGLAKSQAQLSDFTFTFLNNSKENGNAK